ncbi:MAG TPA: hypothetical protein V6D17_14460 [Candidatus Obscuribacterales bacterium]
MALLKHLLAKTIINAEQSLVPGKEKARLERLGGTKSICLTMTDDTKKSNDLTSWYKYKRVWR